MKKAFLFSFVLCTISVAALHEELRATTLQDGGREAIYHRDGARFALEGRFEEAIAAFKQAIALDPKNGNTYYSLGNVYSEVGRWDDAATAYRKAISLNKNDVEAYNGLGIALGRLRLYGQAAAAFERAIEIYPKWAEPHFHLSRIYKSLGRDTASQVAYSQAVRLRPDYATNPPRTFMLAEAKTDTRSFSEKAAPTVNAVSASETRKDVAGTLASPKSGPPGVSINPGRIEAASKAPNLNSGDAKTYYELGVKHGRDGRYEDAVAAFRQSVILDRNNADTYFALGNAYAELGRWRESVDAYEQAVRLNPKDVQAYERLGRSYAKLRETTPRAVEADAAIGARVSAAANASPDTAGPRENGTARGTDNTTSNTTAERNTSPTEATVKPRVAAPVVPARPETDVDPTAIYRVGPNDLLDIRVLNGRESRETSYKVTPTGLLDYPSLSEPLQVGGLTTGEIETRLSAELKRRGLVVKPEVAVGVREYASHTIILSGLVKDPGTKVLRREGVPLYVIVAHAQPLPEAGRVLVVSHTTGQSTAIDLSDTRAMNILVRPGDVITVQAQPKQFFYIAGAVRQPGQKEFHTGLTLTQAVLAAGGVAQAGAGSVTVARQGSDGRLSMRSYNLKGISAGQSPDPFIQPGDRIEVLR